MPCLVQLFHSDHVPADVLVTDLRISYLSNFIHSAMANPVIHRVVQAFEADITYIQHIFPLWLHHQAFDAAMVRFRMKMNNFFFFFF
jgi:hypothetical protein